MGHQLPSRTPVPAGRSADANGQRVFRSAASRRAIIAWGGPKMSGAGLR